MIIAGIWGIPAIRAVNPDSPIAAAPLPVWEGTERNTILYSWSWFVGNQSSPEEQAAAWKLANFLSANAKRWWDDCGFIQGRNSGLIDMEDIAAYRVETEPLMPVFTSDFAVGKYMFRSTRFYEIADAMLRAQSLVLEGDDASSVLGDAQSELEI
jgi:ABC-type glycerol-3-phosphate transport system substrate-binding protein